MSEFSKILNSPKHNLHFKQTLFDLESRLLTLPKSLKNSKTAYGIILNISKLCLSHGLYLTRKLQYEKAEFYLNRALLELKFQLNNEILLLKIEIAQVLASVYLGTKEYKKGYDLLININEEFNEGKYLPDFTDIYLCGIDKIHNDIAKFAYKLQLFDISSNYLEKTIYFIENLMQNQTLLKILQSKYLKNPIIFEEFIDKKSNILVYNYYLLSKIYEKTGKIDLIIEILSKSLKLSCKKSLKQKINFFYNKIKLKTNFNSEKIPNFSEFISSLHPIVQIPIKRSRSLHQKEKQLKKVLFSNEKPPKPPENFNKNNLKLIFVKPYTEINNKLYKQSLNNCSTCLNISQINTKSSKQIKKNSLDLDNYKKLNFSIENSSTMLELTKRPIEKDFSNEKPKKKLSKAFEIIKKNELNPRKSILTKALSTKTELVPNRSGSFSNKFLVTKQPMRRFSERIQDFDSFKGKNKELDKEIISNSSKIRLLDDLPNIKVKLQRSFSSFSESKASVNCSDKAIQISESFYEKNELKTNKIENNVENIGKIAFIMKILKNRNKKKEDLIISDLNKINFETFEKKNINRNFVLINDIINNKEIYEKLIFFSFGLINTENIINWIIEKIDFELDITNDEENEFIDWIKKEKWHLIKEKFIILKIKIINFEKNLFWYKEIRFKISLLINNEKFNNKKQVLEYILTLQCDKEKIKINNNENYINKIKKIMENNLIIIKKLTGNLCENFDNDNKRKIFELNNKNIRKQFIKERDLILRKSIYPIKILYNPLNPDTNPVDNIQFQWRNHENITIFNGFFEKPEILLFFLNKDNNKNYEFIEISAFFNNNLSFEIPSISEIETIKENFKNFKIIFRKYNNKCVKLYEEIEEFIIFFQKIDFRLTLDYLKKTILFKSISPINKKKIISKYNNYSQDNNKNLQKLQLNNKIIIYPIINPLFNAKYQNTNIPNFYFEIYKTKNRKILRITINQDNLLLSTYDPFSQKKDYYCLKDSKILIRILTQNNKIKAASIIERLLYYKNEIVGKKIGFFYQISSVLVNKAFEYSSNFLEGRKKQKSFKMTGSTKKVFKSMKLLNENKSIKEKENNSILSNNTAFTSGKSAFILISSSAKAYIKNQFHNTTYFFHTYLFPMGLCYLRIELFSALFFNETILKIHFNSSLSKTKKIKIYFSQSDSILFEFYLHRNSPFKLLNELKNRIFLNKLFLYRENLLYKPAIILKEIIYTLDLTEKTKIISFWKPIKPIFRTIHVKFCKLDNKYSILSIKKNLFNENWIIQCYYPKNGNLFIANIYLNELNKLPKEFWQFFPKHVNNNGTFFNFWNNVKNNQIKINKKKGIIQKIAEKTNFSFKKKEDGKLDFFEIYFWSIFIQLTKWIPKDHGKIINVLNYNGVLQEFMNIFEFNNIIFVFLYYEKQRFSGCILKTIKGETLKSYKLSLEKLQNYCLIKEIKSVFSESEIKIFFNQLKNTVSQSENFLKEINKGKFGLIDIKMTLKWNETKSSTNIVAYKGILSIRQKTMVFIVINKLRKEINIKLLRLKDSYCWEKTKKIKEIENKYPFLKNIEPGLEKEFGIRIIYILKNILLVESWIKGK